MTRNATLGALAVALLVVASGLSVGVGASPTADGTADASPVAHAQDTTTQADQTTTQEGQATTTAQAGGANETASITFEDQNSNGSAVVVQRADLSAGGFVVVYAQNGTVLGNTSYLEPGTHENLTVSLDPAIGTSQVLVASPHFDTNDNETFDFNATQAAEVGAANATDGPYLQAGGLPVTAVSFVTVGNDTARRTTTE